MNKPLTKGLALILSAVLLTGCSQSPEAEPAYAPQPVSQSDIKEYTLKDHVLPVVIEDLEILVGETKLQALLDHNLPVKIPVIKNDEIRKRDINAQEILAANTSYEDAFFWIEDAIVVHMTLEAGAEDVLMKDAVITGLELHLSHNPDVLPDYVLIDGTPVTELTFANAAEILPDFKQKDLSLIQRGADYKCTLLFSPDREILYQFTLLQGYEFEDDEDEEMEEYLEQEPWQRIWPSQSEKN